MDLRSLRLGTRMRGAFVRLSLVYASKSDVDAYVQAHERSHGSACDRVHRRPRAVWAPLVLAAWSSDLLRPALRMLERALGGRRRGAGVLVVRVVVVVVLLPIVGVAVGLTSAVRDLLDQARAALEGQALLTGALLGGSDGAHPATPDWADLATAFGGNAWRALSASPARRRPR